MVAACFAEEQSVLKVGSPVSGFIEGSNSKDHFGAQLAGWDTCLASEWSLLDRRSFPAHIETNGDVIAALPQLHRENSPIAHAPNVTYGLFTCPRLPKYKFDEREAAHVAANRTSARNRNPQNPNPPPPSANSCERRLRQRWLERQNDDGFRRNRDGAQSAWKCIHF